MRFTFTDERTGKTDTFHFGDGLTEFVRHLNTGKEALHEPIRISGKHEGIGVEVALQYQRECETIECGYANARFAPNGGTHIDGFRRGLREAFWRFAKQQGCWSKRQVKPEDTREGVTVVVSVDHPEPRWESATASSLGNEDAERAVARVVREELAAYLARHPLIGARLCKHIAEWAEAREKAKEARDRIKAARRGS